MLGPFKKRLVLGVLAAAMVTIAAAPAAEAGWRKRVVRRAYRPVVVAPVYRRPVVYSRAVVRPRGVSVVAPGVGVWVGY